MIEKGTSILIPSWNNLKYLKPCIESIMKYSEFPHEIIVHVNEGTDGTIDWLKNNNITYTHTTNNVGVCKAMNQAFKKATKDFIFYFNDDIIALPEWDSRILSFCKKCNIDENSCISSTMIEPEGNNPCFLAPYDFGRNIENFKLDEIINKLSDLRKLKPHTNGSTWPPNVIHRKLWESIGGYSEEFSPGFGSDPDLCKKLYDIGIRKFIGVGDSLVYHFMCKTTKGKNFIHNNGDQQFYNKYGMTISDFVYRILKRGTEYKC